MLCLHKRPGVLLQLRTLFTPLTVYGGINYHKLSKFSMSENETNQPMAETEKTVEETPAATTATVKKTPVTKYIIAVLLAAVIILGALYLLEKEGRSSTNIFSSIIESQQANSVVATVNGEEIINSQLETSIQQFAQVAAAQGVDASSTEAQLEIRNQALEVLINTQLLKQAAREDGIEISDEAVAERLESIKTDIGGEEILAERMEALGIGEEQLRRDVKDELLIQKLLESIFAETDTTASEEEIAAVYEDAGGEDAGLPSLDEVREQVEAQITASKEQAAIDEYLAELKAEAEIDIVG